MNKKITVDILMFIAIIVEFLSMPILIHEMKYNKRFFKSMHKGKYTLKKNLKNIINIGLLASLLITIISGIFISRKSLKGMKIGNHKISHIHKSSSIFSLIFLALHLIITRKKLLREYKK